MSAEFVESGLDGLEGHRVGLDEEFLRATLISDLIARGAYHDSSKDGLKK